MAGEGSPSEGWYAIGGNPCDLGYFDGRIWTWRRWLDAYGAWHDEPIPVPSPVTPGPRAAPAAASTVGPPSRPADHLGPPLPTYGTYGAYGAQGGPAAPARPFGQLDLELPEPHRQARWTTLLRALLVLPNAVVLEVLGIGMLCVTVCMWCAALSAARVPTALWRFARGVLAWQARTAAYATFLTDRYPPFALGDADHPVRVALEGPPERFSRAAVLFRIVLAVPAGIVTEVFTIGIGVMSLATWLSTLVAGRCPRALHLANAGWLRYTLRYAAFYCLLTTEYPSKPFGDPPPAHGAASLERGQIVLSASAKTIAAAAIVIGALALVGDWAFQYASSGARVPTQRAITALDALESRSAGVAASYRAKAATCATWQCLQRATPILERGLATQISSLEAITFPTATTRRDAEGLLGALREEDGVLRAMGDATTPRTFEVDLRRLVALTRRLQPVATTLVKDLGAGR